MDWIGYGIGIGLDLCAGLLYEHRFAMLIRKAGPDLTVSPSLYLFYTSDLTNRDQSNTKPQKNYVLTLIRGQ